MYILHLDTNHPVLIKQLQSLGHTNHQEYTASKDLILQNIKRYDGIVLRSRFTIDRAFIDTATRLKFIARVGAGLENIDIDYAVSKNIALISAPEANCNAVAEHALGMLLSLFNNLNTADAQVRQGQWLRKANRGTELDGKTVGIIGYGNIGKGFAKKLSGFDVTTLFYDIEYKTVDNYATQVSLETLQEEADVLSLHIPETPHTLNFIHKEFIQGFKKPFWLINTARGKTVNTKDLVSGLKTKKILGAGLDVLEYESRSFENMLTSEINDKAFQYLINSKNVILTPHIAGWTVESHLKLAQIIVNKIHTLFP